MRHKPIRALDKAIITSFYIDRILRYSKYKGPLRVTIEDGGRQFLRRTGDVSDIYSYWRAGKGFAIEKRGRQVNVVYIQSVYEFVKVLNFKDRLMNNRVRNG